MRNKVVDFNGDSRKSFKVTCFVTLLSILSIRGIDLKIDATSAVHLLAFKNFVVRLKKAFSNLS